MTERSRRRPGVAAKELQAERRKRRHRQVIRNRIVFALIILLVLLLVVLGARALLSGLFAGGEAAEVTTITLAEDGKVTLEEITDFDTEEYDKSALKEDSKELVESFNETYGKDAITIDKLKVGDGKAYMKTSYQDCDTYTAFTSYGLYADTVENAAQAGYDFNEIFTAVVDGQKGAVVDYDSPGDFAGMNVLCIEENVQVKVPGIISYVSGASTEIVDDSTVSISPVDGNTDAAELVYIVYTDNSLDK
ncbi:MAG: hypothetical protein K5773_08390 [Pseudobutyrivibrio sp.]|nr:hypothetical protein [Pseudobutyrivibrio sp.]